MNKNDYLPLTAAVEVYFLYKRDTPEQVKQELSKMGTGTVISGAKSPIKR